MLFYPSSFTLSFRSTFSINSTREVVIHLEKQWNWISFSIHMINQFPVDWGLQWERQKGKERESRKNKGKRKDLGHLNNAYKSITKNEQLNGRMSKRPEQAFDKRGNINSKEISKYVSHINNNEHPNEDHKSRWIKIDSDAARYIDEVVTEGKHIHRWWKQIGTAILGKSWAVSWSGTFEVPFLCVCVP